MVMTNSSGIFKNCHPESSEGSVFFHAQESRFFAALRMTVFKNKL